MHVNADKPQRLRSVGEVQVQVQVQVQAQLLVVVYSPEGA